MSAVGQRGGQKGQDEVVMLALELLSDFAHDFFAVPALKRRAEIAIVVGVLLVEINMFTDTQDLARGFDLAFADRRQFAASDGFVAELFAVKFFGRACVPETAFA